MQVTARQLVGILVICYARDVISAHLSQIETVVCGVGLLNRLVPCTRGCSLGCHLDLGISAW